MKKFDHSFGPFDKEFNPKFSFSSYHEIIRDSYKNAGGGGGGRWAAIV